MFVIVEVIFVMMMLCVVFLIRLMLDLTALARIRPLYMEECQIVDSENHQVAAVGQFTSSEQLEQLPSVMGRAEVVVMNSPDSQVHTSITGTR